MLKNSYSISSSDKGKDHTFTSSIRPSTDLLLGGAPNLPLNRFFKQTKTYEKYHMPLFLLELPIIFHRSGQLRSNQFGTATSPYNLPEGKFREANHGNLSIPLIIFSPFQIGFIIQVNTFIKSLEIA